MRGAAIVMVLVATVVLYVMASAFIVMAKYEIRQIRAHRSSQKAFYVADAGLQIGAMMRNRRPIEPCSDTAARLTGVSFPAGSSVVGRFSVECEYLDPDTLVPYPDQTNPDRIEVVRLRSKAVVTETTGGFTQDIKANHSWILRTPFAKAVWATGNLHFETSFPLGWCLATFSLWCADDLWAITGVVHAARRPVTDWAQQCPPFNWFDSCKKYWLIGWRCCLLLKGCSSGQTCCCGFSKDTGAKYWVRRKQTVGWQKCGRPSGPKGYRGDCNSDGLDNEAEGEAGGGPPSSGWYYVKQSPTEDPFPQFQAPPDPRLPGSNSKLQWMTGPDASNFLKTNGYLKDVWIDGDLDIDWAWWQVIGPDGIGIWGTVYVNGRVNYKGATFSRLKMYAYEGFTNCTPKTSQNGSADMPAGLCPGGKPPKDTPPGTLIINRGNLTIESTGTPDLGRVNIVLIEGNRLELKSFCGLRSFGIYYVGGPLVDHDGDPATPPIRLGGDIYVDANTRYGGLAEPLRLLACDWITGSSVGAEFVGQRHTELHGATIGNDVYFRGSDQWSEGDDPDSCLADKSQCPNILNIMDNPSLWLPEGFYNAVKIWNWRKEL